MPKKLTITYDDKMLITLVGRMAELETKVQKLRHELEEHTHVKKGWDKGHYELVRRYSDA